MIQIHKVFYFSLIFTITFIILFASYLYIRNLSYSPNKKYSVLMAGRSTTDLVFRYWNLPWILNKVSIWRAWPLPYNKYVYRGVYFEYLPVPSPASDIKKNNIEFGDKMYEAIYNKLKKETFNVLFFKFCFVDFGDKSIKTDSEVEDRFQKMIALIQKIYILTGKKNMALFLGNSLPAYEPGIFGQKLRIRLNEWIKEFGDKHDDVIAIKLFENLTDKKGRLRKEYSISPNDKESHINFTGFKKFERTLFDGIKESGFKIDQTKK